MLIAAVPNIMLIATMTDVWNYISSMGVKEWAVIGLVVWLIVTKRIDLSALLQYITRPSPVPSPTPLPGPSPTPAPSPVPFLDNILQWLIGAIAQAQQSGDQARVAALKELMDHLITTHSKELSNARISSTTS